MKQQGNSVTVTVKIIKSSRRSVLNLEVAGSNPAGVTLVIFLLLYKFFPILVTSLQADSLTRKMNRVSEGALDCWSRLLYRVGF